MALPRQPFCLRCPRHQPWPIEPSCDMFLVLTWPILAYSSFDLAGLPSFAGNSWTKHSGIAMNSDQLLPMIPWIWQKLAQWNLTRSSGAVAQGCLSPKKYIYDSFPLLAACTSRLGHARSYFCTYWKDAFLSWCFLTLTHNDPLICWITQTLWEVLSQSCFPGIHLNATERSGQGSRRSPARSANAVQGMTPPASWEVQDGVLNMFDYYFMTLGFITTCYRTSNLLKSPQTSHGHG